MAKNIKGRKFVATAASAALVASAIVPVASAAEFADQSKISNWAADAVAHAVEKGYMQGDGANFNPQAQITKAEVATVIFNALGLEKATTGTFTDVPAGAWYAGAVNALQAKGIVEGNEGKFEPTKSVTLAEAAQMVVKALGIEGTADLSKFADASTVPAWANASIQAMVANGYIEGGEVNGKLTLDPLSKLTRERLATMFVKVAKVELEATLAVESVSATNAKTLTLSGAALDKLKAEEVTVEGNKVMSITPATNGKSATLTLETPMVDGQEYKVSVKVGEETKEFTVKFTFVLADVAVTTTTLEANKDKQFLQVTINGAVTDLASIDSLGYDIEFQADKAVFENSGAAATTSTTGEIREEAVVINDTFNVKAVLKKDGKTAESKTVEVSVVSKATPAIGNILIDTDELALTKSVISTKDTGVVVSGVESNTGDVIDVSGLNSFASSNPEIALINATTGAITPIKAGKTTISVKAGNVSYSKEITVVAEERVATKATAGTVFVAPGANLTTNVVITDQFGEKVDASDITAANIELSERTGAVTLTPTYSAADGVLPVSLTSATTGSYTVVVKDLTTLKNLGQFTVRVSADNVADNYKLEVADTSKGVINLAGAGTLTLNAKEFTKSGAYLQTLTSTNTEFTVESVNPTVATVAAIAADGKIEVTGVKVGTTQIVLKKNGVQVATATVTVKEEVPTIESITWKANGTTITVAGKQVTYKDIFNYTETASGVDTIIEGVKLNIETTSKVRIDLTTSATVPFLYLDSNDNGVYDAASEEKLGDIQARLSGSAGETITTGTDWTTNILGSPTAVGDKGSLVITVTDDDTNTTVRASSTLKFDVK